MESSGVSKKSVAGSGPDPASDERNAGIREEIRGVAAEDAPEPAAATAALPEGFSDHLIHPSRMTVGRFIEEKFAPEHIYSKRYAGRSFYQAILKHVIQPEEVDRIFQKNATDPRKTLRSVAGWPYLNQKRLCDVTEEDIQEIADAALSHGYSVETIRHIRSVIGAIFSHAIRENHFAGVNPVSRIKPLRRPEREENPLNATDARTALQMMRYPEKHFILIGAMAGLLPSEITGLQWGRINLTEKEQGTGENRIPPLSIAVRKRWYRGELDSVRKNAVRDARIPRELLAVLYELKRRPQYTGAEDYVLVTQNGTPVSHDNLMTQRLRPIAKRLGVPSISARSFQGAFEILAAECATLVSQPERAERYAS
ncbi:hypothetical protein DYQ86_21765 [Acidobacteria bacterium AB60]|nr:hypothetical protein DYQ86_21765 [Acidobacteria bacterium AB60]